MHDVFISYSHVDASVREDVCSKLESSGIRCWYAPRNIQPGEEWADTITKALKSCSVVILIFSKSSNASAQVLREIGLAVDFKKTIIPYNSDGTLPTGSMQYYLSTLHWLNASNDREESLNELLSLARKSLDGFKPGSQDHLMDKKRAVSKNLVLSLFFAIILIGAGLAYFLYSRGYFKNENAVNENTESVIDDELADLINEGVTLATGEDIHSIDLSSLTKWTVFNNKLYYFSPALDSPDADNYLFSMLEDNAIQITEYDGEGKTEVVIPEMIDGLPVMVIGPSCFENNSTIERVVIPETVDYIADSAFFGCDKLSEIIFSGGAVEIGYDVFSQTGLTEVVLPDFVKTIGDGVFNYCKKLEKVYLSEKIELIPQYAFTETPNLKSVTIAANKVFIDADAFDSGSDVTLIGIPGSYTEKYAKQKGLAFEAYVPEEVQ